MDVVICRLAVLCALLALPASAAQPPIAIQSALDRWQPLIDEAAHRFAIPARWIRDVMRFESAGRAFIKGEPIRSSAGAMGLMQVMPATYAMLRKRYGLGVDPDDPRDNIFAGAAYLSELYERYGWPSLFAVYHAGPARFEAYLSTGRPLPKATRAYLAALITGRPLHDRLKRAPTPIATIFVRLSRADRDNSAPFVQSDSRVFVHLSAAGAAADETSDGDRSHRNAEASDARLR